jgi:hypothetical protein
MAKNAEAAKAAWRFYVYELIDPRDGLAFYVGKGQRDRLLAHESDARKGVCSEKCDRIREIWAAGQEVDRLIVAYFRGEQAAYDFEAERVDEYGLDALTNIIPGGGVPRGSFIRRPAPPQPWTAETALKTLLRNKATVVWFAEWLKFEGRQDRPTYTGSKWVLAVLEIAFTSLFPKAWALIKDSREALDALAPHLRQNGVELVYG